MAKHNVVTTDSEIDSALACAQDFHPEPRVTSVEYKPGRNLDLLILRLSTGHRHIIPREDLQGLETATRQQIAEVEITGHGTGLHWPSLDLDYYLPGLLRRIYGTRQWLATIGRKGGIATTRAKRKAARANGLKGGRPAKKQLLTSGN